MRSRSFWLHAIGSAVFAMVGLVAPGCGDDAQGGALTDTGTAADVGDGADAVAADATADTAAPPAEHVVTLMDRQPVALLGGVSLNVDVEVPEDVVSITVSVIGDVDGTYSLNSWLQPDQTVLVKENWVAQDASGLGICTDCDNRVTVAEAAFATLAPNNPVPTVVAGEHTFKVFGQRAAEPNQGGTCGDGKCSQADQFQCPQDCAPEPITGDVLVSVHAKVIPGGLPETGVLDLNLHFTGSSGWTATSAPEDAGFQRVLERLDAIYSQVGIRVGEVAYIDIDSAYRVIENVQGPDSDLKEMFALSASREHNRVNLFFVEELSSGFGGGFGVILGVAGGIPGPTRTQGTAQSGVAIATKQVDGAPAGVDTTMAHEVGHFLGLFHTSEQDFFGFIPKVHDPLPDTPEDDASYIMFNTGEGDLLSPFQGRVMRANPWVRHPETAEETP